MKSFRRLIEPATVSQRSYVTGAEPTYVKTEGCRGDSYDAYRYRSDPEDFEICLKGNKGSAKHWRCCPAQSFGAN